jgi:nucleoside-diphosphate-sugar epimerase
MTRVVVTGAGGFIGSALTKTLLKSESWALALESVIAIDLQLPAGLQDPRLHPMQGNVADADLIAQVCEMRPEIVIHLASVPGRTAEQNYALGRRVNLDATADWLEGLGAQGHRPRFVYASSIAVYGEKLPAVVDEQTPAHPSLSYGVHKRACELLVADATRRGWIEGCSLRLPGVVARPAQAGGLMSAFMSDVFWALADGQKIKLPVTPDGTAWWISVEATVANLLMAAQVTVDPTHTSRVYQMPALYLQMQEVVGALARRFGVDKDTLVEYEPDAVIQRLFASYPPLATPMADALGLRHDGDVSGLVDSVYSQLV